MKTTQSSLNAFRLLVILILLLCAAAAPVSAPMPVHASAPLQEENPPPDPTPTIPAPGETPEPEQSPTPPPDPQVMDTSTPAFEPTSTETQAVVAQSETPPPAPGLSEIEYQALLKLYETAGGEGWSQKDGWLSDASPCTWFGVTCLEDGEYKHVTAISLPGNNLSGTIPPEIGNLIGLVELRLSGNQLASPLPEALAQLPKLEKLYLNNNAFFESFPAWIASLPALKELSLSANQFYGPLPAAIGNLGSTLTLLDVAHNHVWGEIPSSITKLTLLNRGGAYTDIGHNHLTSKNLTVRDFLVKKDPDWAKSQTPINPTPLLQGANPSSILPQAGDGELEVRGKNMVNGVVVYWNGEALPTTWVNDWTVRVAVPGAFLSSEGVAALTAANPFPTLGPGTGITFYISSLVPADGSTVLVRRPKLQWTGAEDASYELQLSTYSNFSTLLMQITTSTNHLPALPKDLPLNKIIYWRVRPVGSLEWEIHQFRSANPPPPPALYTPANNALNKTYTQKLTWTQGSLPSGTLFDRYEIQVAADAGFADVLLTQAIGKQSTPYFTLGSDLLKPNRVYYWRVRTVNRLAHVSNWSAARSFRTIMKAPLVLEPIPGQPSFSLRPAMKWAPVFDEGTTAPASYTLQLSLYSNFSTLWLNVRTTEPQYTLLKNLPHNKTIYWRVRANAANGPTVWTKASFRSANPPSVPLLSAPADDVLLSEYSAALAWTVSSVPTGTTFKEYRAQLSLDPEFPADSVTEYVIAARLAPSVMVENLLPNATYYWRVQAVNTLNHRSGWSVVQSFRTVMLPPGSLDIASQHTLRPAFSWTPPPNPAAGPALTSYTVQFSLLPDFSGLITTGSTAGTAFVPPMDLPSASIVYWRVRANGLNGPSAWAGSSFYTADPPSVPVPQAPDYNSLSTDFVPVLAWSASQLSQDTALKHYLLQVAEDGDFSTLILEQALAVPEFNVEPGTLSPNASYYWRVRAENTAGQSSTWSSVWMFRTALDHPTLLAPLNTTVTTELPQFTWELADDTGVDSYTIEISQEAAFGILISSATVSGTTYIPEVPMPTNRTIYWRVRAEGDNGPSAWSSGSFTSANPPTTPALVSPENGAVLTTNPIKLDWSTSNVRGVTFDYYEVQISTDPAFTSPQVYYVSGNRKTSELAWPTLSGSTTYYWRVRAAATNGHISLWSDVWSFTTP